MMPNIVRGDRMSGLVGYLVGPGRSNEHTEPHLVAGDGALLTWYDDNVLDRAAGLAIARHLDVPHKRYGVDVAGGHVWHCSLSLRTEERQLPDGKWQQIAEDFIALMEFDDQQGTRDPCRWAAIHHGVSKNGNDHIHIVVDLVREDGTKANTFRDFRRAQAATRALEIKYGLEPLESARTGRATRGYDPAEREAQARGRAWAKYKRSRGGDASGWEKLATAERQKLIAEEMRRDEPRYLLALKVRAAATAAGDEAEFVRRLRRDGLLVRARLAEGTSDVVVGYSVAERPVYGERPIWYGGGHLGRDLTLPRLRAGWPDTPVGASAAAAEWVAARRGRRVVAPGREALEPSPEAWEQCNAELRRVIDEIRQVGVDDDATWAAMARRGAGVLASWSRAIEIVPGNLARAAEALSRSAQTRRLVALPARVNWDVFTDAAMLAAAASRGGKGEVGQAVLIRSMLRLAQAVHDAAVETDQARQAALLVQDTRARLIAVRDALPPLPGGQSRRDPETPQLDPELQARMRRVQSARPDDGKLASPLPPPEVPRARRSTALEATPNPSIER